MKNGKIALKLKWEFIGNLSSIDHSNPILKSMGIYMFVYDNYPYYVGTTRASFSQRLANHIELFKTGGRTLKKIIRKNEKIIFDPIWIPGKMNKNTGNYDLETGKNIKPLFKDQMIDIDKDWLGKISIFVTEIPMYYKYKTIETIIQYKFINKLKIEEKSLNDDKITKNWHSLGKMENIRHKEYLTNAIELEMVYDSNALKTILHKTFNQKNS
jgi:hypothetical protein